jgi:hypothetical protein
MTADVVGGLLALAGLWDPLLPAALPCVHDRHCWQAAALGCRGSDASVAGVLPGASKLCPSHCRLLSVFSAVGGVHVLGLARTGWKNTCLGQPVLICGVCWGEFAWPACFGCMLAGVWCMCRGVLWCRSCMHAFLLHLGIVNGCQ